MEGKALEMHAREDRKEAEAAENDCSEVSNTSSAMMNGSLWRMLKEREKRRRKLAVCKSKFAPHCRKTMDECCLKNHEQERLWPQRIESTHKSHRQTQVLLKLYSVVVAVAQS